MTTLYQFEHSPFCIPVVAIFKALGTPLKIVNTPYADRSEIINLTKGAYYQAPVLVDGKKTVFESTPESQDVARYIDAKFAGARLFPEALDGIQSLVISYLENDVEDVTFRLSDPKFIDSVKSIADRGMIIRHKERKFGRGCVGEWKKQAPELRKKAEQILSPLDQMLNHTPFLLGETPVYADYLLLGIIGNLTYRGYNTIPARLTALKAWEKRISIFRYKN